jgi:hypothetical protein
LADDRLAGRRRRKSVEPGRAQRLGDTPCLWPTSGLAL